VWVTAFPHERGGVKASLKQRLIWILLGLTLFAWVTSALVTYVYAGRVLQAQIDRQLEQYADLVTYITGVFARQIENDLPLYESWTGHDYDRAHLAPIVIEPPVSEGLNPAVNVWEEGNLIAIVADSPLFPQPLEVGFADQTLAEGGGQWRTLSRFDSASGTLILVGIELAVARHSMAQTLGRAFLPLLIVLPLTVLMLYIGVTRGLRPLHEVADQISHRSPGVLDPMETDSVPDEVAGVVGALNALLARLATAMEAEQRFTANAAHELMTPLAAIKTEVQLCQRQLRGEPATGMLNRIAERVDRASHSVEQLLTLARVDPDAPMHCEKVNLRDLLEEVLAETSHLAVDRQLEVELAAAADVAVWGNREALAILLRNLLVNAFRYATGGSAVRIELDSAARLAIANDCEPLSAAEFNALGDRFYRVPGREGLGVGLGLSIARRIAQLHGASLALGPDQERRGFRAVLRFSQRS